MVDSKNNTSAYYTISICHFSKLIIILNSLYLDKDEYNALQTSTIIEPKVPRFMDVWVHGSSPLDINLDNVTSIILPPLIWLESDTIPLKMSVKNIGMTCTNTISPITLKNIIFINNTNISPIIIITIIIISNNLIVIRFYVNFNINRVTYILKVICSIGINYVTL